MSDNVVILDLVTRLDVAPDRVLEGAASAKLEQVVILGYKENGDEYFASNVADGGTVLWLMERAKLALLNMPETDHRE